MEKVKFILKQMLTHARNLGLFVFIYKMLCSILRSFGMDGGIESLISGFIGGFWAFGNSKGIAGSVNNQITLYLFARGFQAFLRTLALKYRTPGFKDVRKGYGFRVFAGVSLALILYMTEYQVLELFNSLCD